MLAYSPFATQSQPAYKTHAPASALHAQHWWFSGKIGRCQPESFFSPRRLQMISASPGFDSRPMHTGLPLSSFPFLFGVSVLPHLGTWREVMSTFWIRRTDFQDWRCCLAGHRRLQSTSWIKPSYLLFGQHVNHKHLPSPSDPIPVQHPLTTLSTDPTLNA
jgi:hypothetical protein